MFNNVSNNSTSALAEIRVLDLTHHVSGPYCTKLLSDFGATVTKVERPGIGDAARHLGPFAGDENTGENSLLFAYLNTGKLGITVNLKHRSGKEIITKLIKDSDILVENFSPGVMSSFGLEYKDILEINPSIVMISITNFGQTGPYKDYKATDIVEYALGGLMYILGTNDREPLKHALKQAQFKAGTNAATASLIALMHTKMSGEGQYVDISIQESIASALRDTTSLYTYSGLVRGRQENFSGDMPRNAVPANDGFIVPIHFGGPIDWSATADFLKSDELKSENFSTADGRLKQAELLQETIETATSQWDKYELFHEAHKRRGYIYGVVQNPSEVVESPQYKHRKYFREVNHPLIGKAQYPGPPFSMSETPWRSKGSAPLMGQHNEQVICKELGYSEELFKVFMSKGII